MPKVLNDGRLRYAFNEAGYAKDFADQLLAKGIPHSSTYSPRLNAYFVDAAIRKENAPEAQHEVIEAQEGKVKSGEV